MTNPNDPEVLKTINRGGGQKIYDPDTAKASPASNGHRRNGSNSQHRSRGSHGSIVAESVASERRSRNKRSMSKGNSFVGSFSSTKFSLRRHKSGSHSSIDCTNNDKAAAIPEFGAWDETDPKSGDGYTRIFSKIKEERQNASGHRPNGNVPSRLATCSNIENQYGRPTSRISKYCCCLFSSESK